MNERNCIMPTRQKIMSLILVVLFSVGCSGVKAESKPEKQVSAKKNMCDIIGSSHVIGRYYFTDKDFLNEGADRILELGSKVIKVWFYNGNETPDIMYPYNSDWPVVKSLVEGAQVSYYKKLFDKPFSTFVMNVASIKGGRDPYYWRLGITDDDIEDETRQFYEFTKYLLTTYKNTEKTFVLQHHEGDWHLRGNTNMNEDPTEEAIANMIKWLNARQAGVDQARQEIGMNGVQVFHAAELSVVVKSLKEGKPNMVNRVIPYTHLDLVSYSCWHSIVGEKNADLLLETLDYIAAHTPPSKYFGEKNVYIGEFGLPENDFSAEEADSLAHFTVEAGLKWGCPYIIYWQLYCNELADPATKTPVKNNKDVRGFWLIRPDGTKSPVWDYFHEMLN